MYELNASRLSYSNGVIEGIHRMIKQIRFGFRNYNHLVYRIYYRLMSQKITRLFKFDSYQTWLDIEPFDNEVFIPNFDIISIIILFMNHD